MLDTPKKLPSFSNEPQTFADMTLFLSPRYGLTLHVRQDIEGIIREGVPIEGLAKYYSNYEGLQRQRFEPVARAYLSSINRTRAARKESPLNPDEENNFLNRCCNEIATIIAGNCGGSQDLSSEFCAAAKNLGAALQARLDVGINTITVIQSGSSAENFMVQRHG